MGVLLFEPLGVSELTSAKFGVGLRFAVCQERRPMWSVERWRDGTLP